MGEFCSFFVPNEKPDTETGNTRNLRVAAYEYFKSQKIEEGQMLKAHKKMFWQDVCLQRSWTFVDVYLDMLDDDGTAWKERPNFDRLLEDCRTGRIDMIVAPSMSRFCANVQACIEIVHMLSALNPPVDVVFLQEGIYHTREKESGMLELLAEHEKNQAS